MLYEDKFGVLWKEEDVNKLSSSKIRELELKQYAIDQTDLYD